MKSKSVIPTTDRQGQRGASGSASVLWSQALCNDYYHAIPAADHDPNATGWIALCGSFCCGTPLMVEETEGREACKTCLHLSSPNTAYQPRRGENQ